MTMLRRRKRAFTAHARKHFSRRRREQVARRERLTRRGEWCAVIAEAIVTLLMLLAIFIAA
ncbi:MAG: hypothetical protein M5U26_04665 [Planctomycetota bacterium]|nr:hypothetical protein [Planctomycetota bacterium]